MREISHVLATLKMFFITLTQTLAKSPNMQYSDSLMQHATSYMNPEQLITTINTVLQQLQ